MLIITRDQVFAERAQRVYRKQNTPPPPSGTQIFCGNLPREMLEIELFPYFSTIGEIYEFRLMMEFSGFSRGFCFVTYMTVEDAAQAVRTMHGYILKDRPLCVYNSWDNTKLFINGVPPHITPQQIQADLRVYFPGLLYVVCNMSECEPGNHQGWAFLVFDTHRHASLCRKQIWPNKLHAWGVTLQAEWARPTRSTAFRDSCSIVMLNVPINYTMTDLYNAVEGRLQSPSLKFINKNVGESWAKFEFKSPIAAFSALKFLRGIVIEGLQVITRKYHTYNTVGAGVCQILDFDMPPINSLPQHSNSTFKEIALQ